MSFVVHLVGGLDWEHRQYRRSDGQRSATPLALSSVESTRVSGLLSAAWDARELLCSTRCSGKDILVNPCAKGLLRCGQYRGAASRNAVWDLHISNNVQPLLMGGGIASLNRPPHCACNLMVLMQELASSRRRSSKSALCTATRCVAN